MTTCRVLIVMLVFPSSVQSSEPWMPIPRRLPPPGIELPSETIAELQSRHNTLQQRYDDFVAQDGSEHPIDLLPDVEVFLKAVGWALKHGEFYRESDAEVAHWGLNQASERLGQLAADQPRWPKDDGLVVRGYRSTIDGSVQPYGLEIPDSVDLSRPVPLYVWLHGRGDKNTDLYFLKERASRDGQFKPKGAIVVHPFGRQCIGFKSAGEIDVLEAIGSVAGRYPIDRDRIVLAGFSMGGAGAWHLGAHYTDHWAAVHAGAGFAETRLYTNLAPDAFPAKYEQTLWNVYDVPNYARNFLNVPLIAYSGEIDKQKQAADVMAAALAEHGLELKHVIGPGMGHKYHPDSLKLVQGVLDHAVARGRDRFPKHVHLQTPTLRYNKMHWVELLGMKEHWQDARIDAELAAADRIVIATRNVRSLWLTSPAGDRAQIPAQSTIEIDGESLVVPKPAAALRLVRQRQWRIAGTNKAIPPFGHKRPGLQGPIDDAFLAPFLLVMPTGEFSSPTIQRWVDFELAHLQARWRAVYRGEPRTKRDDELTGDDLERYHLVLFGDRTSNRWIAKIADRLPILWNAESVEVGKRKFNSEHHMPLLICPNPENPARYIVLNSGPTHREAHDRTNSLQNPKLPDWAVIDVRIAPDDTLPGKVVAADFFDEAWRVQGD